MDNIFVYTGFVILLASCALGQEEGDIRLHNAHNTLRGFLQVYHENAWSSVCNVNWTQTNSDVVCKQLGFNGAALPVSSLTFINVTGKIYPKRIECSDKDETIADCKRMDIKDDEGCTHDADVKIDCLAPGYLACVDSNGKPPFVGKQEESNTKSQCINMCRKDGFVFAGIFNGSTCSCGSEPERIPTSRHAAFSECTEKTCEGDEKDNCGSETHALIYDVNVGSCGGVVSASEGTITSPGFTHRYESGLTCMWVIKTDNPWTKLSIPHLNIEEEDMIEIEISKTEKHTIKKDMNKMIPSTESKMIKVKFVSKNEGKGFILTFRADTQCAIPDIKNGSLMNEMDKIYRDGDILRLQCDRTFERSNDTVRCRNDGKWFPTPKCEVPSGLSMDFIRTLLIMAIVGLLALGILFALTACMFGCIGVNEKRASGYQGITTEIVESPQSDSIQEERYTPLKDEVKVQLDPPQEEGENDNTVNEQQQQQPSMQADVDEDIESPIAADEEGLPGDETIEADENMA